MKHRHHILPQKAPYLEELHEFRLDDDWQVYLTVSGHACQHDVLYRVFGWEGDKIARDALSGTIGREEAVSQARKEWIQNNPEHHRNAGKVGGKAPASEKAKETARRLAKKLGNTPMWHNGEICVRSETKPGPDWKKGYGYWWTNGSESKLSPNSPGDEWYRGRTYSETAYKSKQQKTKDKQD